ncbi:MAG: flagellar hook-associated protein FlgL [Calditrichota bacterium]
MRITGHGLVEKVVKNIQRRQDQLSKVQEQLSTGLKVAKASDDPGAANQLLNLRSSLLSNKQWQRNIDRGLSSLCNSETALSQVSDLLTRVQAAAVQGANEGISEADRRTLAEQVNQELNGLMSIANQRVSGRYLFGGGITSRAPYIVSEDENDRVSQVESTGGEGNGSIEYIVGVNERIKAGPTGYYVFGFENGDSVFQMLLDLRQALENDDPEAVGAILPRLEEATEQIAGMTSMVGAQVSSLTDLKNRLDEFSAAAENQASELGDLEMLGAVTNYQEQQTAYELALRTAANIIQPSLVYFLQ